jgi:multiple sugar transport system permease protein
MKHSYSKTPVLFLTRCALVVVFLLPLLWMLAAALHPTGRPLPQSWQLLPDSITLNNFVRVWQLIPMGRFILNSLFVSTVAVPITILIASWAGFGMAQLPQASQRRWVLLSLVLLMVPGIALWSTRFVLYTQLGWQNTFWALIAPAWMGTSPFYVLMFYRAFRRIPSAIFDAARLDGAGIFQTWRQITFPIVRPTTIGVALLSFIFYWGDFMSPLLYLRSESLYTLPIALQSLQQMSRSDWSLLMSAAVWATLLPLAIFLLLQPYFNRMTAETDK